MIVVKMELDVGGLGKKKRMLGVIVITNDGSGTKETGNYTYAISHAGKHFGKKSVFKKGRVVGFPRHLSPYRLLCRVLKDAKEN